jgi:hypothetical protein
MKRYVLFLAALMAPGLLSSAPVTSEALGSVKYEVRFQGAVVNTKVADATISLESATWNGQKVLHARAAIYAVSIFRLFMNPEYLADSYLVPSTREPLYYMNPIKRAGKVGKFECIYDKESGAISSEFTRPPADPVLTTFPLDGKTMDLLSFLQYVRFLDLAKGKSLSVHVLKGGLSVPAVLTNQGPDAERYPDRAAERFLLTMTGMGLMENGAGNKISVWRSSGSDRTLLALEVDLGSGIMVVSLTD